MEFVATISLQFSFLPRSRAEVFFRDEYLATAESSFRYIEQCTIREQRPKSSFNYFINNHYRAVFTKANDQIALLRTTGPDEMIFSGWISPLREYASLACHMSYLHYSEFYSILRRDVTNRPFEIDQKTRPTSNGRERSTCISRKYYFAGLRIV